MLICWNCGKETDVFERPARTDVCPHCRADLKSCRGCRFHDPGAAGECTERQADPPADRAKANFCDFFVVRPAPKAGLSGGVAADAKKDAARSAFDKLFGG